MKTTQFLRALIAAQALSISGYCEAATFNLTVDFSDGARLSNPNKYLSAYYGVEILSSSIEGNVVTTTSRTVSGSDVGVQFTYSVDPILLAAGDTVLLEIVNFGLMSMEHNEFGMSGLSGLSLRGLSDIPIWDAEIESAAKISYDRGSTWNVETFVGSTSGSRGPTPRNSVFLAYGNSYLEPSYFSSTPFSLLSYRGEVVVTPDPIAAERTYPDYVGPGVEGFLLDRIAFDLQGKTVFISNYGGRSLAYSAPEPKESIVTTVSEVPLPASGWSLLLVLMLATMLRLIWRLSVTTLSERISAARP